MINRRCIFYNIFVFLLLWFKLPAFALTDPTRSPTADNGNVPIEGVIVRGHNKVVFLSGELVSEGDETLYGKMKEINFNDVSFNQGSRVMTQSVQTDVKQEKFD